MSSSTKNKPSTSLTTSFLSFKYLRPHILPCIRTIERFVLVMIDVLLICFLSWFVSLMLRAITPFTYFVIAAVKITILHVTYSILKYFDTEFPHNKKAPSLMLFTYPLFTQLIIHAEYVVRLPLSLL